MVSLNNEASFPFLNLSLLLVNDYNITILLMYKGLGHIKPTYKIINNKDHLNIISELNVSNITLKTEDDYLSISFFFNEKNKIYERNLNFIFLRNEIYSFNMSEKDFIITKQNRSKLYNIKEELYYYNKTKEPRCYQYYIHSHSIKSFDKTYEFPVIDDHYNNIPTPLELLELKDFLKFTIILKKKNY